RRGQRETEADGDEAKDHDREVHAGGEPDEELRDRFAVSFRVGNGVDAVWFDGCDFVAIVEVGSNVSRPVPGEGLRHRDPLRLDVLLRSPPEWVSSGRPTWWKSLSREADVETDEPTSWRMRAAARADRGPAGLGVPSNVRQHTPAIPGSCMAE